MEIELHIQRSYKLKKKPKIIFGWHVISSLNTQQLFLGFSGSSLPRPRAIPSGREGWDKKSLQSCSTHQLARQNRIITQTWQQLAYIHGLGAELPPHVFNPDKQVYHLLNTQQLPLGFSWSLLLRPSRDTLETEKKGELVSDTLAHLLDSL